MLGRGVIWDLWGEQLTPWQSADRLYAGGFRNAELLAVACAVMEGESGRYLQAWHHNCVLDGEGNVVVDAQNRVTIRSTDLGFIQRNVFHKTPILVEATPEAMKKVVNDLFFENAQLANGSASARIAWTLYEAHQSFSPWYAYSNGSYKRHLAEACLMVGNFLGVRLGQGQSLLELRAR